jgi:hypothetical protein
MAVTSACAHACPHAHPCARAPAHARTLFGRQGRAFGSAPPCTEPHRPARRAAVAFATWVALAHTRVRGKGRAFGTIRVFSPLATYARSSPSSASAWYLVSITMTAGLRFALAKSSSTGPWVASRSLEPFCPARFPRIRTSLLGVPTRSLPREHHRRTATRSPSCTAARPRAVLFLPLAGFGFGHTMLRSGSGHCRENSPPARCS